MNYTEYLCLTKLKTFYLSPGARALKVAFREKIDFWKCCNSVLVISYTFDVSSLILGFSSRTIWQLANMVFTN